MVSIIRQNSPSKIYQHHQYNYSGSTSATIDYSDLQSKLDHILSKKDKKIDKNQSNKNLNSSLLFSRFEDYQKKK